MIEKRIGIENMKAWYSLSWTAGERGGGFGGWGRLMVGVQGLGELQRSCWVYLWRKMIFLTVLHAQSERERPLLIKYEQSEQLWYYYYFTYMMVIVLIDSPFSMMGRSPWLSTKFWALTPRPLIFCPTCMGPIQSWNSFSALADGTEKIGIY